MQIRQCLQIKSILETTLRKALQAAVTNVCEHKGKVTRDIDILIWTVVITGKCV